MIRPMVFHCRPLPRPVLPAAPVAWVALLVVGALGLTACSSTDPLPSGPLPSIAAPSKPSVASGVPQAGEPVIVGITYVNGTLTGDTGPVRLPVGTEVRLTVLSDVADTLHITGYDRRDQVTINQPVQLRFLANKAGTFDVELEDKGVKLTTLVIG